MSEEVVYLLTPTSNHNWSQKGLLWMLVVYLLTPTSNHNYYCAGCSVGLVVYLLTPTSNHNSFSFSVSCLSLYIFWLLHQTTTVITLIFISLMLYIFWLLHQTTTKFALVFGRLCCISFDSYIKPQLSGLLYLRILVVYLLTPTSNHNLFLYRSRRWWLYIFWLLHQTTTSAVSKDSPRLLYIFWLLHQTTTYGQTNNDNKRCISFDSYIKPQPYPYKEWFQRVVYLLTPTSNHNLLPTMKGLYELYIFWLLHQTTTPDSHGRYSRRCISFDSYIKPQHTELVS